MSIAPWNSEDHESDPWCRPSMDELKLVLEGIEKVTGSELRNAERLDLSVPAEITTMRGNTISAMTREISRTGLGLMHRGSLHPGPVMIRMASETREFEYRVMIDWCTPCENGMFLSGGHFITKERAGSEPTA